MERRRGRPPKVGEAKRVSFHGRLRLGLHEQLQAAAERANRSLNEEVEHRLERTLALEAPRDPSALLAEDSGKSELEARVDKAMAELKEKFLLLVGYHGAVETKRVSDSEAKPEPKRKSRRPQQREPGETQGRAKYIEPGDPVRLLPVKLSIVRDDDGTIRLLSIHDGIVIRETPLDKATALRISNELLAASGAARR